MQKQYREVLSSKEDIEKEMMEQPYVKGCRVESGPQAGLAFIYVKLSIVDYVFRLKRRIDDIHDVLRPKMNFMVTYEVKPKLFL